MILCRDFIHGVNTILRYIARVASVTSFYGQDAIQAAYVCSGWLFAIAGATQWIYWLSEYS